jgi:2-C-methyl-D-erythritol 4-phosphate cytidylyltransferase
MSDIRDVGVVIVAAGQGTRTGEGGEPAELKQFRWIAGKPMLLHSIQAFERRADVGQIVAVLPRSHAGDPPPWIFQSDLERLLVSVGGAERGDSVWSGIEDLEDEIRIVVVHDAARPLVTDDTIDRVIATARQGISAVAALPVADTLKEVDEQQRVVRTVDRERFWRVQTPQAFPRDIIEQAYRTALRDRRYATDDAALVERVGHPVVVVRGAERGMKVTDSRDFALLEALASLEP